MNKAAKTISNVVYGFGTGFVVILICGLLFGGNITPFPDAMIAYTVREIASLWLSVGSIPMMLACMAVYKFNGIKNSPNKKRTFILIFLPGFICAACALFWIVVIAIGYVNMFLRASTW